MAIHITKGQKIGFLINTSTSEVKSLPPLLEGLIREFGAKEITILVAYGRQPLMENQKFSGAFFLQEPCPQGEGVLSGFKQLMQNGAAKLFYLNYDNLAAIAGYLPKMADLVLEDTVATARWTPDTAFKIPCCQYFSETSISQALAIAEPSLGQDFQLYLGLIFCSILGDFGGVIF